MWILNNIYEGMDWIRLAGFCEHGNEVLMFHKEGEFIN
jgi:hypothetical protein